MDEVFHKVADRYDVMNDLMSLGLHRVWKDISRRQTSSARHPPVRRSRRRRRHGRYRLPHCARGRAENADHCCRHQRRHAARRRRARAEAPASTDRVGFVVANAEALPFSDAQFDAYTIAFGIRNVPRIEAALGEAFRVLKRGGRFLCLEFSRVDLPVLDRVYDAYSFAAIPAMGKVVTGDGARLSLSRGVRSASFLTPSCSPTRSPPPASPERK